MYAFVATIPIDRPRLTNSVYSTGHLSDSIHQLIVRCNNAGGVSSKRQRRLAKYALQVDECGDDIKALSRFVNAQVIAFRKILKKYRVCTHI